MRIRHLATSALLLAAPLLLSAQAANAQHSGSYTTRRGGSWSYSTNTGHGSAEGSVTGPKGNTTSGSATARPEGGGSYDVSGTVTGPRGTTRSGSRSVTPQ